MAKKHPFRCGVCNSEVLIYRKGKGHRVMICHECDRILAVNGILKPLAKRTLRAVAGEIPGASLIMEGAGLVSDLKRNRVNKTEKAPTSGRIVTDSLDKKNIPQGAYWVDKVL